jgi:hypothetical protein
VASIRPQAEETHDLEKGKSPRTFAIATLNVQDVNVIVVLPDASLEATSEHERQQLYWTLQRSAASANLAGNIVLIWQERSGATKFIAPPAQHPFFQIMKYDQLRAQINGILACEECPSVGDLLANGSA